MIRNYLSLIKFSHTIFAMPFAVIGFFLAFTVNGKIAADVEIPWMLFANVVLCMVFARSAAMAFNRWADRHFDKMNERTAAREIPGGVISAKNALLFVFLNSLLFVATTWFINPICFYLSPVALIVILGYSYTKRFTALCHLVLGLGLSLAPIGAYLAVKGVFDLLPILFSALVLFWVSGFDIIYALQDEEFDKAGGLRSIPAVLGKGNALIVSRIFHLICAVLLIFIGLNAGFGKFYFAGTAFFTALLIFQHTRVKANDLSKVNLAFFTSNGIAGVVFAVFFLIEVLLS